MSSRRMFSRSVSACSRLGFCGDSAVWYVVVLLDFRAGDLAAVDARHHVGAVLFAGTAKARKQQTKASDRMAAIARPR